MIHNINSSNLYHIENSILIGLPAFQKKKCLLKKHDFSGKAKYAIILLTPTDVSNRLLVFNSKISRSTCYYKKTFILLPSSLLRVNLKSNLGRNTSFIQNIFCNRETYIIILKQILKKKKQTKDIII